MGILNMKGYNKPGKGVDPLAPKSEGIVLFFEIFIRKFWKLIQANLLFIVFNIPAFLILFYLSGLFSNAVLNAYPNEIAQLVGLSAPDTSNADYNIAYVLVDSGIRICAMLIFTIFWGSGPASAGLHYVLRNYAREEHSFLLSDFKDAYKENFKQSIAVFIIDIIFMFVFFYAISFYSSQDNIMKYAVYIMYCLVIFYTIIHLFIYPLMVRYKLSLPKLFKNAALFAMVSLPYSFLVIAILLGLTVGVVYFGAAHLSSGAFTMLLVIYLILMVCLMFSFTGFIVSYNAERQIIRHLDDSAQVDEKPAFEKKEEQLNRRKLY